MFDSKNTSIKIMLSMMFASAVLVSCTSSRPPTEPLVTVLPVTSPTVISIAPSIEPSPVMNTYESTTVEESAKHIKMNIPQIKGLADETIQLQLNTTFRQNGYALAGLSDVKSLNDDESKLPDDQTFEATYSIKKQAADVFSYAISAYDYWDGAAHPNQLFRSYTYDLKTGKQVLASECIQADASLINAIRNYQVPDGSEHDAQVEAVKLINAENDDSALIAKINNMDLTDSSPSSYWTSDYLGLNFDTIHVVGDFVQLEIPYSSISSSIKTDNEVCRRLSGLNEN